MQKFTCGSNAHNSPSFTTHSGLWAWNSPHPLPSACLLSLSRERLLPCTYILIAREVKVDQLLWSTYNTLNDVNYDVIQYFTRMHPHIYFTPFRISTSNFNMITHTFATLVTSIYNNYPNSLISWFTPISHVLVTICLSCASFVSHEITFKGIFNDSFSSEMFYRSQFSLLHRTVISWKTKLL